MKGLESRGSPGTLAKCRRSRLSRQQALVAHDRWLISYADFMTLLFALFVVLFATSRHNPAFFGKLSGAIHEGFNGKGRSGTASPMPQASRTETDALEAELRTALSSSVQKREVSLQRNADGLVLSFQELGFFRSGEANVLPGQSELILRAGAILKRHGASLRVEGHSDDQPIHTAMFASNWELSAARAMTVLLLLVDDAHYNPTELSMAGYGPYRPIGDNLTVEGRQQNRRVDLVVIAEHDSSFKPAGAEDGSSKLPEAGFSPTSPDMGH